MPRGDRYPTGAARGARENFAVDRKFGRHEGNTLALGATTDFVEVITFSGEPDAIDVLTIDGAVELRCERRAGQESSTIVVPANTVYETGLSRERVLARRFAVATPATVCIVGKWADPYTAGDSGDR